MAQPNELFNQVDSYINELFRNNPPEVQQTEKAIADSGIPQISISANQGKFLYLLARLAGAKRILEIGTLGGYSTVWLAKALPEDGILVTLELERRHAEVASENFRNAGLIDRIQILLGDAQGTLERLANEKVEPFDLIFIDADKPPYAEYLQGALRLSKPGTLIIADNVIREGGVLNPHSHDENVAGVHRFNLALSASKNVEATILQTVGSKEHDGMAIALVK